MIAIILVSSPMYSAYAILLSLALQINMVFLGFSLVALGHSKDQKTKALDKDKSVKQTTYVSSIYIYMFVHALVLH